MNSNNYSNDENSYVEMLITAKELIHIPETYVHSTVRVSAKQKEKGCSDVKQAIEIYLESLKYNRNTASLLFTIARCYSLLRDLKIFENEAEGMKYGDQALSWAKRAIEIEPNVYYFHTFLGYFYIIYLLDYEASAEEYRFAIAQNPQDATVFANAAAMLYGSPDSPVTLKEAIGWLECAVQLAPDNSDYLESLGILYYKAGRNQDALKTWVAALSCPKPLQKGHLQEIKKTLGIE